MSKQATKATPEQQELYWHLAEGMTKAGAAYLDAKAEYDQAKAELERLSDKVSDVAAEFVSAEGAFEQFTAEHIGTTFSAFRPEHIDAAFAGDTQTWEL